MTWKPFDVPTFMKSAPTFAQYAPKLDDRVSLLMERRTAGATPPSRAPSKLRFILGVSAFFSLFFLWALFFGSRVSGNDPPVLVSFAVSAAVTLIGVLSNRIVGSWSAPRAQLSRGGELAVRCVSLYLAFAGMGIIQYWHQSDVVFHTFVVMGGIGLLIAVAGSFGKRSKV